jgi:hypothetical protein
MWVEQRLEKHHVNLVCVVISKYFSQLWNIILSVEYQ